MTYLGIDGGIGRPRVPDYSAKFVATGAKSYVKTFGRMALDGGIIRNPRSYAGKTAFQFNITGGVQAQDAAASGLISRFAVQSLSGGVQAVDALVFGSVGAFASLSGGVQSQDSTVSGALDSYPVAGWALTDFTTNFAGLDPDSPFSGDSNYSAIVSGDKCHYETTTTEDSLTISMNGLGEFTATGTITQINTFDFQIYDLSDGTLGAIGTITVTPGVADVTLSGGVQSQPAIISGNISSFTVHTISGGAQSDGSAVSGIINPPNTRVVVGGVQSGDATVSGAIENVVKISGSVQAESPVIFGSFKKVVKITNGVQAQPPTVSGHIGGIEEVPGTEDQRELGRKFTNRGVKWKSTNRRLTRK